MMYRVTIAETSNKKLTVKAGTPAEAVVKALDEYVRDYWDGCTEFDVASVTAIKEASDI